MTDTYQASARRSTTGTGEAYWFFDSLMVIRADQPGQPVIIEATVAPGGGAPLHVHADLDDSFYLVSGTAAALATLVRPALWRRFAGGAVSAYSLTPGGWHELTSASQEAGAPPRAR